MHDKEQLELLLQEAKGSSEPALNELCRIVMVRLRPIVEYRLRGWPKEDQQDLLQNTIMTFCDKLPIIQDNPIAVALGILRNKIGNELQSIRRKNTVALEADESEDESREKSVGLGRVSLDRQEEDIHDAMDRRARAQKIVQAIAQLQEFCRTVLIGLLQGYAISEIWERMQRSEPDLRRGTFDKRIFDCKKKLKTVLGGGFDEP